MTVATAAIATKTPRATRPKDVKANPDLVDLTAPNLPRRNAAQVLQRDVAQRAQRNAPRRDGAKGSAPDALCWEIGSERAMTSTSGRFRAGLRSQGVSIPNLVFFQMGIDPAWNKRQSCFLVQTNSIPSEKHCMA